MIKPNLLAVCLLLSCGLCVASDTADERRIAAAEMLLSTIEHAHDRDLTFVVSPSIDRDLARLLEKRRRMVDLDDVPFTGGHVIPVNDFYILTISVSGTDALIKGIPGPVDDVAAVDCKRVETVTLKFIGDHWWQGPSASTGCH